LLAILAVRHQSLRLLGLARKLLLVDEVHACDAYVHRLLCTILQFHAAHGNSAILLSATLPQAMRAELIRAFSEGAGTTTLGIKNNAYPLLTHFSTEDIRELPVEARTSISGPVDIQPLHSANEVHQILREALEAGGCACWVRNTVLDALEAYREWVGILGEDQVMLFHARYTLADRLKIERDVIRYFGPNSKEEDRRGRLLIATQVVEQSLDLDFDFMVSDLAPIDLLIQRAGRLHRHARGQRNLAILGVYMPEPMEDAGKEWFKAMFPKAAWVYKHHGQLWLTATWLCERKGFSMPDDAREMIERVYGDESQKAIPKDLILAEDQTMGQDMADRSLASLNSLKLDDGYRSTMTNWQDDAFAPTRLGEPTVTVRLARLNGKQLVPWFSENTGHDWELSQLSIRESQIARENPNYLPEFVAAAREVMPDEGRYCVVIPMKEDGDTWRGQALNSQDQTVDVIYNSLMGLEVSKGGNA
ncbi:MAG: CRISPR-associated helicase Cas3', partial [Deltaproteobacteria bacterium]|nr:CRISPR-associated helicase Cas3' [Deltaproteobacteria bacterium]